MMKQIGRIILGLAFVMMGISHFTKEEQFKKIVPAYLPLRRTAVWISGVCEVVIGTLLLLRRPSHSLKNAINLFLLAVFPANLYMARKRLPLGDKPLSDSVRYGRLPLQFVLMYIVKKL